MKHFRPTHKRSPRRIPILKTILEPFKQKHVKYFMFVGCFASAYTYMLSKAHHSEDEVLRIGAAGSITMLVGESTFYCIDAVNTRSKILTENVGFKEMITRILRNEGLYGLYKGYSATFYGTILYGYLYFFIYKSTKLYMKDKLHPDSASSLAMIYASASAIGQMMALMVYYPYELVKIRILTKSEVYKYEGVWDAFKKIYRKDSAKGLYRGSVPFFLTQLSVYTVQLPTYELIIDHTIKQLG